MIQAPEKLLTMPELAALIGMHRVSIYRLIRGGKFPQPLKVTERAVRWRESDIAAWQDGLPQGVRTS